jgi:hypothetical protein
MGTSLKTGRATTAASRREFLRGGLRHVLLAGLAAAAATLARNPASRLPGQTCVNQGICRGCGAFDDCNLPPALSAKQFELRRRRRAEAQASPEHRQSPLTPAPDKEKSLV